MSTIPEQDRIYKDCIHEFAVVFVLIYVDNTTVLQQYCQHKSEQKLRSNCEHIENMVEHWLIDDKESSDHFNSKQGQKLVNPTKIPVVCDADVEKIPIPDKLDPEYIARYQKVIGELLRVLSCL
jgi:hypothetical protein